MPRADTKARSSCSAGCRVLRLLSPILRISGSPKMVAIRYCQNAMPVEAMPKPPYCCGVGSTDCRILLPAKARLASSMKLAPSIGRTELEEIWVTVFDPFHDQFPQGHGDRKMKHRRPDGRQSFSFRPFSLIRTM